MNFKELIKKKSFWAAVAGAIVLVLQLFGIKADMPYVNEAVSGFCAVLVALGLLSAADKRAIDEGLDKTDSDPVDEKNADEQPDDDENPK